MFRAIWEHRSIIIAILVLILVVAFIVVGTASTAKTADEEGRRIAERAVRRTVMQCYALEGVYPPSMEYLYENYGLYVDLDRYVVIYRADSAAIMPYIKVELKNAQGEG